MRCRILICFCLSCFVMLFWCPLFGTFFQFCCFVAWKGLTLEICMLFAPIAFFLTFYGFGSQWKWYIYIYPYPFRMRVDSVYCFWCEVVSLVCISGVAEKKPVVQRKSDVDEGRTLFVRSVSHSLWAVKRAAHSSLSDVSVSVIYRTSVLDTWMKVLSLYWLFTFLARAKYIIHAFRIFGRTGKLLHNVGK